jgi:hypothetical protein
VSRKGRSTKKGGRPNDARKLTDAQQDRIKEGRKNRRASIGDKSEEKKSESVDAPVDEASLYGQWLDENYLVNEDGSSLLVRLDRTIVGTLRKYGQRPLNDPECEEIKEDALVTPTMPLHPAVLVTFKFTVKQVRLWLGTVLSSPRKYTHQLPFQCATDSPQSFVCVQLLLLQIYWGVAGKQHQTEGIKRAAVLNARVRALRRMIPGSLYALGDMTPEALLKAVSFLVDRSQKVDNMNRHTSSIDRHSATREIIVGKYYPECPVHSNLQLSTSVLFVECVSQPEYKFMFTRLGKNN